MKRRPARITIAVVFCILLLLSVSSVLVLPEFKTVHLRGGTELSLAAVTQGPTNTYIPGSILQRLLYRVAPAKGIRIGNFNIQRPPLIDNTWRSEDGKVAWPNKAAVWIRHSGGTNASPLPLPEGAWFSDIRAALADETGEEW